MLPCLLPIGHTPSPQPFILLIECLHPLYLLSPYIKLFGTPPNYTKLCSFGCLCYPWLRPYAPHKLAPRSVPCVFLAISYLKVYICVLTQCNDPRFERKHVMSCEGDVARVTPTGLPIPCTRYRTH